MGQTCVGRVLFDRLGLRASGRSAEPAFRPVFGRANLSASPPQPAGNDRHAGSQRAGTAPPADRPQSTGAGDAVGLNAEQVVQGSAGQRRFGGYAGDHGTSRPRGGTVTKDDARGWWGASHARGHGPGRHHLRPAADQRALRQRRPIVVTIPNGPVPPPTTRSVPEHLLELGGRSGRRCGSGWQRRAQHNDTPCKASTGQKAGRPISRCLPLHA